MKKTLVNELEIGTFVEFYYELPSQDPKNHLPYMHPQN